MSIESDPAPRGGWIAVFVGALALRVLHLVAFSRLVFYDVPFGDAKSYVEAASDVAARGPWAGPEPYFQGPLFPLILGLTTAIGLPAEAWLWAQAVVGALTAVGVYLLACRLFGPRAGLVAGFCYAGYDLAIFFDGDLLAASVTTALATWGLVAVTRLVDAPTPRTGVIAGTCLGLAAWGRPNLLLPALLVALTLVVMARRRDTRGQGVLIPGLRPFLLALAVTFALPVVRNVAVSGEPVFTTGGGVNAYIGSHRGASGIFRIPPASGLSNDLALDEISRVVASRAEGRQLSASESARWWLRRTRRELVEAPGEGLALLGRKILWLVNHEDVSNHLDIGRIRETSIPMRVTPIRSWVLLTLGVIGGAVAWSRAAARPAIVYAVGVAVSLLPFFITARYRLSLMPVAAVMAGGLFAPAGIEALRTRRGIGAAVLGVIVLALAWVPLGSGRNLAAAYVNEGALHAERGDTEPAAAAFRRALELDPENPRAQLNLATLALDAGDPRGALVRVEAALRAEPTNPRAWNSYGVALAESARFDEALDAFERAAALLPAWEEPAQNHRITWARYREHCRREVISAGLAPPSSPETARIVIEFLSSRGYRRAAADLEEKIVSSP